MDVAAIETSLSTYHELSLTTEDWIDRVVERHLFCQCLTTLITSMEGIFHMKGIFHMIQKLQ